ncbi:MAG: TrpB-like pyridoxal phosphate-dependent enzyme [Chloroflexi bacterium]|nr:TrpB-like pyridoxal phosphate-dependent enzyme [Chloroflexota bacterium]
MAIRTVFRGAVLPTAWYNVVPDLPFKLPPPVNARTGFPVGPHDLAQVIPHELLEQELGAEQREVRIPREVRDLYRTWRPTPLVRAKMLEEALGTPARLYYKYEGTSPTGSYEANTAIPQAYYAGRARAKKLVSGAGDGEWATSLAMATNKFGLVAKVYVVQASLARRPRLKTLAELWNAQVVPSPSTETRTGRQALAADPEAPGSLGLAMSEALEEAMTDKDAKYATGTLLTSVILHQTVIGLEARRQMEHIGELPDVIIGAVGGGSGFGGLIAPFLPLRLDGRPIRFVAAEPAAVPSLTRGTYAYDYPDAVGLLPLLKMYTLGHNYAGPTIHAGSMRYHGMSPLVSALYDNGLVEAVAVGQVPALGSAIQFARTESVLAAPDVAYCLHVVVAEAMRCKETGEAKTILFAVNTHGQSNLSTYEAYLSELIQDIHPDEAGIQRSLQDLPVPGTAP